MAPAVHGGESGFGVNTGHFGEGLAQLGLDARRIVLQVFKRPLGAGLHRPALGGCTAGFGRFPRQPRDPVVRAAGRVPLRAERDQPRLHGIRKREHQGPAGRHVHVCEFAKAFRRQRRAVQQVGGVRRRQREQHGVETAVNLMRVAGLGAQLPLRRVERVGLDAHHAGLQLKLAGGGQRLGPLRRQIAHAGGGHPVRFACGQRRLGHAAMRIEHADGVGAPGLAESGYGLQGPGETRVAHGEVLGAGVEASKR